MYFSEINPRMKIAAFFILSFVFTFSFGQIPEGITEVLIAKEGTLIGQFNFNGKTFYISRKYIFLPDENVVGSVELLTLEKDGRVNDTVLQKPILIQYVQKGGGLIPLIHFDDKKEVLLVPGVIGDRLSHDLLEYRFNGKYFECIKFEKALDQVMVALSDSAVHNMVNSQSILIKDKEMALAIAEPILFDIYGKANILQQKPYEVQYVEVYWVISGTLKEGWRGGTFLIIIDSRNGQILRITHGK